MTRLRIRGRVCRLEGRRSRFPRTRDVGGCFDAFFRYGGTFLKHSMSTRGLQRREPMMDLKGNFSTPTNMSLAEDTWVTYAALVLSMRVNSSEVTGSM